MKVDLLSKRNAFIGAALILVLVLLGILDFLVPRHDKFGSDTVAGWLLAALALAIFVSLVVLYIGQMRSAKRIARLLQAEKELGKTATQLGLVNRDLSDFTYTVSHDLQEPLRNLTAFSDLLREELLDSVDSENARQYLDVITNSATKMLELIDDLLELSRVGSSTKCEPEVSVDDVVDQAIEDLETVVSDDQGEIVKAENFPIIAGNPIQIKQVYLNLIGNAYKFNEGRPLVKLDWGEQDDRWVFKVVDNGIGIDPKYHDKIFEVFQQIVKDEKNLGTGAGLAICEKIVRLHGGDMWVESELGKGSTFYFTILKDACSASGGDTCAEDGKVNVHRMRRPMKSLANTVNQKTADGRKTEEVKE